MIHKAGVCYTADFEEQLDVVGIDSCGSDGLKVISEKMKGDYQVHLIIIHVLNHPQQCQQGMPKSSF